MANILFENRKWKMFKFSKIFHNTLTYRLLQLRQGFLHYQQYLCQFQWVLAQLVLGIWKIRGNKLQDYPKVILSHDVASGSEITPCNIIDKPLVVYRFSGNVTLRCIYNDKIITFFTAEMRFQSNLYVIWWIESNSHALVLLQLLNSL